MRVSSACFPGFRFLAAAIAEGIAIQRRDPAVGAEVYGSRSFTWGMKVGFYFFPSVSS